MKVYTKNDKISKKIVAKGYYENTGVIFTDNQPNYAYINATKENVKKVAEALIETPEKVKFFNNFCYVGSKCYNGITKEMVMKAIN